MMTNIVHPIRVLPPTEAYKLWAQTYDDNSDNAILKLEEQTLLTLFEEVGIKGKRVIDLGCGTGRHIRHLLERDANEIVGIDSSQEMLSVASQKIKSSKVRLIQADLNHFSLTESRFDIGLASLVLSHVKDLDPVLREIRSLLKEKATLFIADLHWSFEDRGWTRSFKRSQSSSERLAVENVVHRRSDYEEAFHRAGFSVDKDLEPVIDESLRPIFERTNMLSVYRQYAGEPLLVVFQLSAI